MTILSCSVGIEVEFIDGKFKMLSVQPDRKFLLGATAGDLLLCLALIEQYKRRHARHPELRSQGSILCHINFDDFQSGTILGQFVNNGIHEPAGTAGISKKIYEHSS